VYACGASVFIMGCTLGPNYKRPPTNLPNSYTGALAPDVKDGSLSPSVAEQEWTQIFNDPVLAKLVHEAIANNLDLHAAAQRVLEAQAQVGIVRSQQYPYISAGGTYAAVQLPAGLAQTAADGSRTQFLRGGGPTASAAWILDFWGLYRRQTEAARAEMMASVWGQRAVRVTVVESVAEAYLRLRGLDEQLEVTDRTIKAREDSLKLTQSLVSGGAASQADLREAEELFYAAKANLPNIRQAVALEEHLISILLGQNPGRVDRGLSIAEQPHPMDLPAGLPSELLERRPDIQEAEGKLVAANARIGVARAQYFPQISLTSLGGAASNQLNSVFSSGGGYWLAAGSISEPVFDAGRIRSNYRLSKAQEQETLTNYRSAVLKALKDVSDSLVAYGETRHNREELSHQVASATDAVRLARLRYSAGNTSYLEVLTTDTDLYSAQLQLAQAQEHEAASLVQLYAALGGGWR
jgi:multidrug efflux system outer membrane protein